MIRISLVVLSLASGIIYARWLGPEGVGILALLVLAKSFAFRYGNLGFGSSFAYFVAAKKISAQQIRRMVWLTSVVVSLFSVMVLLAVWRCDFSPWRDIQTELFYLSLLSVFLQFFINFHQRVLSGELRISAMNVANIISTVSRILYLVILVVVFKLGILGAISSVVLSDLTTFIYQILLSTKGNANIIEIAENDKTGKPNGTGALVASLWRYGRWNYLAMFSAFFIEELPLILLKTFSANNVAVGLFTKARGLGRQSRIVAEPVAQVLFPFTAASEKELATKRTNILCRNSLMIMALVVSLMALFIKPIIVFLYGEEFLPSADIFYVLVPGIAFWPLGRFLGTHVVGSGKSKVMLFMSLITLAVTIPVCWYLIPRYGAIGAGLSVSAIYMVRVLLGLLVYKRIIGTPISEVLVPRRTDWVYYERLQKMVRDKWFKKWRAAES
ncbi:MAG: oligosaccharide flippase family protein [Desulfobacterales bacterium]|nr:oligosaccharide flippase family protein [Desulfobacterales bacterium]